MTFIIISLADRYYNIERIKLNWSVRIWNVHFLHIAVFVNLVFPKDIIDMSAYDADIFVEQFSKLRTVEPHSVAVSVDIQLDLVVGGFI